MGKFIMILHLWDANIQLWIWHFVQDPSESLAVIGRYISENYDGVALHPIDFIDTSTGKLVAEVMDTDVTTITPVNKLHPREYILASGSSRFLLYLCLSYYWCSHLTVFTIFPCRTILIWKPKQENWKTKKEPERKQFIFNNTEKKRYGKVDSDSDGYSDLVPKGRRSKTKKCQGKCTKSGMKKSWPRRETNTLKLVWRNLLIANDRYNLIEMWSLNSYGLHSFDDPYFVVSHILFVPIGMWH